MRCTPRPSRRFAMRTMEQGVLTLLGTIAFLPPHAAEDCTVFAFFNCAHGCLRDCLLDVSRPLGLTLRPSAPVFRCHRETFDTLEPGTCAGSRARYFSFVFPCVFLDGEMPNRILTACEDFLFKGC